MITHLLTLLPLTLHKPHQLQKAGSRCHFGAHLWAYPVSRGYDIHTSPGHPAAGPPASEWWFVPETPALQKQKAREKVRGKACIGGGGRGERGMYEIGRQRVILIALVISEAWAECDALLCWKENVLKPHLKQLTQTHATHAHMCRNVISWLPGDGSLEPQRS